MFPDLPPAPQRRNHDDDYQQYTDAISRVMVIREQLRTNPRRRPQLSYNTGRWRPGPVFVQRCLSDSSIASVTVPPPAIASNLLAVAGSSIELAGLKNASAGFFNISLTSDANTSTAIREQQLSGFSPFLTHTTLFTASGLDGDAMHTITITNAENKTLALNGMNITVVGGGQTYVIHFTPVTSSGILLARHSAPFGVLRWSELRGVSNHLVALDGTC